jgi:hypothetical protein
MGLQGQLTKSHLIPAESHGVERGADRAGIFVGSEWKCQRRAAIQDFQRVDFTASPHWVIA